MLKNEIQLLPVFLPNHLEMRKLYGNAGGSAQIESLIHGLHDLELVVP